MPLVPVDISKIQLDQANSDARASGFVPVDISKIQLDSPLSRLQSDFQKQKAAAQYQPDAVRGAYQGIMNNVVAPVNNAVGAVISGAGNIASKMVTPEGKQAFSNAADYVANSPVGVAAKEGAAQIGDEYNDLKSYDANGNLAHDLPALGQSAQLAANLPLLKPVAGLAGNALESAGNVISKSGVDAANAKAASLASKIYEPKLTPNVIKDRAGNTTTQGINQTPVYTPSPYEAAAISDLQNLPIKSTNTLQANYNVVGNAVNDEAQSLKATLAKTPVKYKPDYFTGKLDTGLDSLKTDPLIVGDGETVATRVFDKMKEIAANNPNTPEGLLQSRQDFDAWARSKKGSVFDANDTAFSSAVKSARNLANDTIAEIAPNADVKASLSKQSNLLGAMDNIETKLPTAAKTRLGMAMEKVSSVIPKTVTGKLAEGAALAGLTVAAPVATGIAGATGLGGYGAYKLATSPMVRKATGAALKGTGKFIK